MPELPEVETIRRQLADAVVGRHVNQVEVRYSGRINIAADEFSQIVEGRIITGIRRRAKMLVIDLSGGYSLVVHLKMSGKLLLREPNHDPGKHTHIMFWLSDEKVMFFDDMRKFGFVRLYRTAELGELVFEPARLGSEPLGEEFTPEVFRACLRNHSRSTLKPLLLSQKCVVGVGNIYADETLWKARIRPDRKAGKLSDAEIGRLREAIRCILAKSIERGGTSFDQYRDAAGSRGSYVEMLKVYGRQGKTCERCGSEIRKDRLGGRGTHWCSGCQV